MNQYPMHQVEKRIYLLGDPYGKLAVLNTELGPMVVCASTPELANVLGRNLVEVAKQDISVYNVAVQLTCRKKNLVDLVPRLPKGLKP